MDSNGVYSQINLSNDNSCTPLKSECVQYTITCLTHFNDKPNPQMASTVQEACATITLF